MPELPEVETMVRGLNQKVKGRRVADVWLGAKQILKRPASAAKFRRDLKGQRLVAFRRAGKNILVELDNGSLLVIHPKMSGNILVGRWQRQGKVWQPEGDEILTDRANRFLRLIFFLDNGEMLGLSDLRKFAKVILASKEEAKNLRELNSLGPDPILGKIGFAEFKKRLTRSRRTIKQVLLDQTVVAGIGNIYADEILWTAKVYPFKTARRLKEGELKRLYLAMPKILKEALRWRGTSAKDELFRDPSGRRGDYFARRRVYQREGLACWRCARPIVRRKIVGRSTHFCPHCQRI